MSGSTGAARATIDTGLFHDPKMVKLARLQHDPETTLMCSALYLASVLESWSENAPQLFEDCIPAWFLTAIPQVWIEQMISVGLLDADGRIPQATLDQWMASWRAMSQGARDAASRRWGKAKPKPEPKSKAGAYQGPDAIDREIDRSSRAPAAERPVAATTPTRSFGEIMAEMGVTKETLKGAAKA